MRNGLPELGWPLASGGVLVLAGWIVVYALRGPGVELPASLGAALLVVLVAYALGHLARLAATALSWGADAIWAVDVFHERAAADLFDDLADRRFSLEVRERVDDAFEAAFGVSLPTIVRGDDDAVRDTKAKRLEEALNVARARAASQAAPALLLAAADARVDGTRALAAALLLSALASLGTAAHDFLFARAVAHAFSSFSLVALGVAFLVAALAALGRARALSRRAAEEAFLLLLADHAPATSLSAEKS